MDTNQEYRKRQSSQKYPALQSKPEDPPPYDSVNSPFGLERLITLDRVDVRNKEVVTENGEVLFTLKRNIAANRRNFEFDLFDRVGKLVISIRPKMACFKSRYEVLVDGELAVVVRFRLGFPCRPVYILHDAATAQNVLKINLESMMQQTFHIKDNNTKQSVGFFALKRLEGAERLFIDSIEFHISVSQDLDVRYKAAIIGICVAYIQDATLHRTTE